MELISLINNQNLDGKVLNLIQSRQRRSYFVVLKQSREEYTQTLSVLDNQEVEIHDTKFTHVPCNLTFKPSVAPEYKYHYNQGMRISQDACLFEMECKIVHVNRLPLTGKTIFRIEAEGKFKDIYWVFCQMSKVIGRKLMFTSNSDIYKRTVIPNNLESDPDCETTGEPKLGFLSQEHRPFNCRSTITSLENYETNTETEKPNEVKTMKTENIASLMIEGLRTVSVEFAQGANRHPYTYKTLIEDIEVDDVVVVYVSGVPKCAHVIGVDKTPKIDVDSNTNYKWIVCKVDETEYEETKKREKEFADHLLELQQKNVVQNATVMLAEKLGIEKSDLDEAKKILQVTKNTNNESE